MLRAELEMRVGEVADARERISLLEKQLLEPALEANRLAAKVCKFFEDVILTRAALISVSSRSTEPTQNRARQMA